MKGFDEVDITTGYFIEEMAEACYQPKSVMKYHRHLFSHFSSCGIMFKKENDFNEKVSFQAFWKELFANVAKLHPNEYGCSPNAASFDENAEKN